MQAEAPRARLVQLDTAPVAGAALMALDLTRRRRLAGRRRAAAGRRAGRGPGPGRRGAARIAAHPFAGVLGGDEARYLPGMRGRILIAATLAAAGLGAGGWALFAAGAGASPLANAPGCPIFPSTNVWNKRVDALPVAANSGVDHRHICPTSVCTPTSARSRATASRSTSSPGTQKRKRVRFDYADQSDHVGYPIPKHPKIERGSDRAHADRRPRPLPPLRALRSAQDGVGLARRLGRDLEPALEPPAARRRGRAPTPPAFRSCRAWFAGTR